LVSLLCAAGCGPAPSNTADAGTPNPAYWGLADQECRVYDDGSGANGYTVWIGKSTRFAPAATWEMHYATNGALTLTRWVGVTPQSLVLYEEDTPAATAGETTNYVSYSPPPDWLVESLTPTSIAHTTLSTQTTQAVSSSSSTQTTTAQIQLRLTVEDVVPILAAGQTVQASQFVIALGPPPSATGPTTTEQLWFAPDAGIVQMAPATSSANLTLVKVEQGVASCAQN